MNFSIGRKTVLPSQLTNRNGMFNNISAIQHNNIQRNFNRHINNKNSSQNTNIQQVSNNNNNNIIPIVSNKHESVDIKTLYIFTSLYTLAIAERFSKYFSEKGIICKIVNRQIDNNHIIECENDPTLYFFIITPTAIIPEVNNKTTQSIRTLPYKKYILYQTEQYNQPNIRHIDEAIISRAYAIFDYSNVNLAYYNDNIKERVILISPFIDELPKNISTIDRPIDILFIGTLNERRNKIIRVIKHWATTNGNNYTVRVITNKFGKELDSIIQQSKIVINLHYYPNAILEVFRIHDLLGYDCRIISELPQIPEEADLIQWYTPVVDFVPVVDDALRNIKPLLLTIITQLQDNNWNKCISGIKKSEFIDTLNHETATGLISQIRILDPLFYKYYLGLENPYNKITYDIIKNNIDNELYRERKKFAHLHCYDISKFRDFYETHLERIKEHFSIIVTYSIGDNEQLTSISNNILFQDFTILKIPNRGLDIGAKFCAMKWLNVENIDYEYILFLHSKRDFATREKYFKSLIDNLESIFNNDEKMVDGYFPDIQWRIDDNKMKTISGNPEYQNMILPERNTQYRGALLQYLNIYDRKTDETQEDIFIEGNCYILSKKVANKLFSDLILYNILNTETSFDYNWVCFAYNISGSIEKVFEEFKTRELAGRNKLSYDAYIEHAFERVILNCCDSYKLLNPILKNNIPLLNILIRTTYRPEYFTKCINSILSQIYQHYKIIICYDDVKCLEYLYNYKNNSKIEIFEVKTQDRTSQAFYNLYCNELLEKVNDGWIMFLDDDDMFYSKQALEIIAKNLYTVNDILFWKVKLGNNIIYPKNINNITQFNISGEGFIFNHKFKNNAEWDNKRSGDFRFITDLLENTNSFNRRFIDAIICGTQEEVINGLLGKKEFPDSLETFDQLVNYYNIKQIYISKSLPHVNEKVYIYNLTCKNTYQSLTDNSIVFFGLYTPEDIKLLYSLKNSNIFLLFEGSDVENIKHILPIIPRIHIIAISKSIQDRLKNLNIKSKLLTLNLTDKKKCIVAVIPVFGREPLLKYTIRRLYRKNKINHVIVIGESESEKNIAISEGGIFIKHPNRPLGKKWNAGYIYAKQFNPDALLFVGSSDWISSDWIDRAYSEILNGAGYVGKNDFDMIDITNKIKRSCKWNGYVCDRSKETIGIGRLVSRKLLESINFCPFPNDKNNSMDYGMYLHCINNKMFVKILDNDSIFLSISCDLWKNMHEFNMHYNACLPNSDSLYAKDRSGCKNIKIENGKEKCDIHIDCNYDINNYFEYKTLYKNGYNHNEEDIKKLNKEFPEIEEFYKDYLDYKK